MTKLVLSAFIGVHLRLIAGPLWFEPNQGQAHPSVQFLARTSNGYVYLGRNQMAVRDVRMQLAGASTRVRAELEEPLGGISSYFAGKTEKDWHTGIPQYGRVRYHEVYRGIDLLYYASGGNLEYDFVLKPGADPSAIRLAYNRPVRIDGNGDLLIAGLRQKRPRVLQNGHEIACDYLVRDRNHVQLALAQYDRSQPLTVDPVLEFSTYLGGPGIDGLHAVAVDRSGYIYVAGSTQSPQTPSLDPFQQPSLVSLSPFVLKFTPAADRAVYFAVVGSNGWDEARALAVDPAGSVAVTGQTRNATFPLKNPIQSEFKAIYDTAFITRLAPDGKSLVSSTYFGGSNSDYSKKIRYDSVGNVYISGITLSRDIPVLNAFQATSAGGYKGFLAKVAPAGGLLFSTYFGGSGGDRCSGLVVDKSGSAYISGGSSSDDLPLQNAAQTEMSPRGGLWTAFVAKFAP